jgi:diamine N-acetyltransferase
MIHLETITPENWRLDLAVREDQRRFVSDSAGILARAYAYRENRSRAFVIYNNDLPIGMAMYYDLDDLNAYNLSQLFIFQKEPVVSESGGDFVVSGTGDGRSYPLLLTYWKEGITVDPYHSSMCPNT